MLLLQVAGLVSMVFLFFSLLFSSCLQFLLYVMDDVVWRKSNHNRFLGKPVPVLLYASMHFSVALECQSLIVIPIFVSVSFSPVTEPI